MFILALALALDLLLGDPDWIWRRLKHPVVLFGSVIGFFDTQREQWNVDENAQLGRFSQPFVAGCLLLVVLLALTWLIVWTVGLIAWLVPSLGFVLEVLMVAVLIAQKSLYDHVDRVAAGLRSSIEKGREHVALIVGRDVSNLDESEVSKAAIESLAENFSDGVVAPAFWYAVGGLPGILFYKAVNTADSMIGHRNERYEQFGKAAAKLDDVMNWPAARLSTILVIVAVTIGKGWAKANKIWQTTVRDAPHHRSPNAGWPETSFAVALGITLGGARAYDTVIADVAELNADGRNQLSATDINKALRLFLRCCFTLLGLIGFCALYRFLLWG